MNAEIKEIKEMRKKLGMTQKQLASLSGVSQSLIAKMESGRIEPSYTNARKIFSSLDKINQEKGMKACDIMNRKIFSITSNDSIKKAARVMQNNEISQLPVINEGKILGLISESSILKHILDKKELVVGDIMDDTPPIISMKTGIEIISKMLSAYPILIVQEKGLFKGVITKSDVIYNAYRNK